MQSTHLVIATTILSSALALGFCGKIKEKIPFIGGGDEAAQEETGEEKKADSGKKEEAKKEEAKKEEAKKEEEPAKEEEAEKEEEPAKEEEAAEEEEPAKEEEGEEEEEPAPSPAVKKDIPKSVRSKTKIDKILVVGHPSDENKYKFAIKKANAGINECHRSVLVDKPGAVGKVKFKINISPEGKVTNVDADKNKTKSDELVACCTEVFKGLKFPSSDDGEARGIVLPVMFRK
jgi:hypothetical protein